MNNSLATLLKAFERKRSVGLIEADRQDLEEGRKMLRDRLGNPQELDALTVHQGTSLFFYLADWQGSVDLVSRYLTQTLSIEEKAWAWWELIDNLCLLQCCEEAVTHHHRYIDWAQAQWERGHLSSSRLLLTIADCTWAQCWVHLGKIDTWFERFHAIMASVEPTPADRLERFYCLRTACQIRRECGKEVEALAIATRIRDLAQEDLTWERSWEMAVQAQDMEARIYLQRQDMDAVRRSGIQAMSLLENRSATPLSAEETTRLAIQYDNVAATMFLADQYDLSIPLHRRCLELSSVSEYAHLALAAALWVTTREREPVLCLLREGAVRCRGDWFATDFRELAEFEDVRDDTEFEAIVRKG
jgi:hypothetical protein